MNFVNAKAGSAPPRLVDVVVIGAGMGGLAAAAKLRSAGLSRIAVLERGETVGGVWRENRYPNVACDTPIDLYAFGFFPGDKWSSNFAPGGEIHRYLEEFADSFGVAPLVEFGTEVTRAVWADDRSEWLVEASDGRRWLSRYLVWAGGLLSRPAIPDLPGLAQFQGRMIHTAAWDETLSLDGKTVAVVGGGATSIQVVPYAAEHARQLFTFVRTPSYVLPRPDLFFSQEDRDSPEFAARQKARRIEWFNLFEQISKARFPMNPSLIAKQEALWREHFDREIRDPHLRRVMTPGYRFGCKRPLFSNAYYPALNRPNVAVVGEGVSRLERGSIVSERGQAYPVDVVIWATGFTPAGMLGGLDIVGRHHQSLAEFWRALPEAYYGTLVKGFPNLFLINGPNVGGTSVTDIVDAQTAFITSCVKAVETRNAASVEVSADAHDAFNADVQRRANESVMVLGGCSSWYRVGGTGKVFTHWPGTIEAFQEAIAENAQSGLEFGKRELVS